MTTAVEVQQCERCGLRASYSVFDLDTCLYGGSRAARGLRVKATGPGEQVARARSPFYNQFIGRRVLY